MSDPLRSETGNISLRDIFITFMSDSIERFPRFKGSLLVVDMNECAAYGCDTIDSKKTGLTPQTAPKYLRERAPFIQMKKGSKETACSSYWPDRQLGIIYYNHRHGVDKLDQLTLQEKKDLLFVLDHEFAHIAMPNTVEPEKTNVHYQVVRESLADAYALIRQFQRFGADSEYQKLLRTPAIRARDLALNNIMAHFTTFVMDEVISRRHSLDFSSLDGEQTLNLAWRLAMEYTPPLTVIEKIHTTYAPVRNALKDKEKLASQEWLRVLVNTVLDPATDYYSFKFGKRWVLQYLETGKLLDNTPIMLPEDYLNQTVRKLKERELNFTEEDILFRIPKESTVITRTAKFVPHLTAL